MRAKRSLSSTSIDKHDKLYTKYLPKKKEFQHIDIKLYVNVLLLNQKLNNNVNNVKLTKNINKCHMLSS